MKRWDLYHENLHLSCFLSYIPAPYENPPQGAEYYKTFSQSQLTQNPNWIDRTVDTSSWKTYSDSTYGIEFKYPPTWNTRSESHFSGAIVENPADIRGCEDGEGGPFFISVYRTYGIPENMAATSTEDLDALGSKFLGLSAKYVDAKMFPSSDNKKVLFTMIDDHDKADGIITDGNTAYDIILTSCVIDQNSGHYSADELDAFIGIFSSFKFIK